MAQPLPDEETTRSPAGPARRPRILRGPGEPLPEPAEQPDPLAVAREVVQLASDKGAADILLMDIRKMSIIADYFVICSGDNERQIRAISRGIQESLEERWGVDPLNHPKPDQEAAGWVVLDYGGVIVHIFSPQLRDFYRLERLWSEAATLLRMQ
jgi:ribosome-associated protein